MAKANPFDLAIDNLKATLRPTFARVHVFLHEDNGVRLLFCEVPGCTLIFRVGDSGQVRLVKDGELSPATREWYMTGPRLTKLETVNCGDTEDGKLRVDERIFEATTRIASSIGGYAFLHEFVDHRHPCKFFNSGNCTCKPIPWIMMFIAYEKCALLYVSEEGVPVEVDADIYATRTTKANQRQRDHVPD